jgi:hypothetical protein
MADGPLTREELDAATIEFARWRADHTPKPAAKALRAPEMKAHDTALVKAIINGIAPTILALEQRIAELESSALKYCGVYQPSASYQRGNVVTCDGSAFHATRAVSAARPGTSDGWQLMIKHGKDAPTPIPRGETATAHPRENGHYAKPRTP